MPRTSSKEHEAVRFAKSVAEDLTRLTDAHPECRIALVAAPRFLGHLRDACSGNVTSHVRWEESKDLSKCDPQELAARLPLSEYAKQLI